MTGLAVLIQRVYRALSTTWLTQPVGYATLEDEDVALLV